MPNDSTTPDLGEPESSGPESLLTHNLLLGQRLHLHALARFAVAAAIALGALVGRHAVGIEELDVFPLVLLGVSVAAYNVAILVLIGHPRDPAQAVDRFQLRRLLLRASIVLDFVALTAAIWFVGGARSPFIAVYLFHIVIASILLTRRAALLAALLAAVMLGGLILVETTGLLPPRLPAGAVPDTGPLDHRYVVTILAVYIALFALIALSQTGLAEALRRAERRNRQRTVQLEKLSRMRRDFLHVALHDVSAPIGAAAMLLRNLRDGLCGELEPSQRDQVDRALAKLDGLDHLVKDLRILSELESADLRQHSTEISLSFLLREIVDEHADLAMGQGVSLVAEPADETAIVFGVPRLLREAIANYITNAIKYTPRGGSVIAMVRRADGAFRVAVRDNGVGISRRDQARLFEEFVRVGRSNPEVRRVPGTGLGLSIVRRIAEAHRGTVGVDSTPGRGSTFWIELPAATGAESPDDEPPPEAGSAVTRREMSTGAATGSPTAADRS